MGENLYFINGGAYGFQSMSDYVFEIGLKKCKTPEERKEYTRNYQTLSFFGAVGSLVLGIVICGVIALFTR